MTCEEALKWILANYFDGDDSTKYCVDGCEEVMAMKKAGEALEKQVPKKPIVDEWERVKCANGHNIPVLSRNHNMPYCPFCGQHIDWRDYE